MPCGGGARPVPALRQLPRGQTKAAAKGKGKGGREGKNILAAGGLPRPAARTPQPPPRHISTLDWRLREWGARSAPPSWRTHPRARASFFALWMPLRPLWRVCRRATPSRAPNARVTPPDATGRPPLPARRRWARSGGGGGRVKQRRRHATAGRVWYRLRAGSTILRRQRRVARWWRAAARAASAAFCEIAGWRATGAVPGSASAPVASRACAAGGLPGKWPTFSA